MKGQILTIWEIQKAQTRNDLIRLIVQSRASHWRCYRNAVILEVADKTPPVNGFYQQVAEEAEAILGISVTPKIAYDVCSFTK